MKTLVIISQPPYGNWSGREALDMAFSLAAFDQPIALLFTGDGVNWLRKDQQAGVIDQKSVNRNLAAAPVFGVSEMLADRLSCDRFGLDDHKLIAGTTLAELSCELLAGYDHVVHLN